MKKEIKTNKNIDELIDDLGIIFEENESAIPEEEAEEVIIYETK